MQKRRALLIGVPRYHSDAIKDLPCIIGDVKRLHSALESSSYHVDAIGLDEPASRSIILGQINRFCKSAEMDEDLLIYFSGHGLHYNGCDYLVPYDAAIDDPARLDEYLLKVDLNERFDNSNARYILFFIDACREGIELGTQSILSIKNWGEGKINYLKKRNIIYIFSCEPGELSRFIDDGKECYSLFSRALSEIINADYPASVLRDILKSTQDRLNELADQSGKPRQKIRCRFETYIDDINIFEETFFEGTSKDNFVVGDVWQNAVISSSLWSLDSVANNYFVADLKKRVGIIVNECRTQWLAAAKSLPQDMWRDEAYPLRILDRLTFLISLCQLSLKLSASEAALLLVIPFVREGILSAILARSPEMNTLSLQGTGTTLGLRADLERFHQGKPQFIRKAERLRANGLIEDHDAIAVWLMYRCMLRTPEVWMEQDKGGYIPDKLLKSLCMDEENPNDLEQGPLTVNRLLEIARCIQRSPEYLEQMDRPEALKSQITIGIGTAHEQIIREKMLAFLLNLSSWMAIDIRTLDDVLIDHIGLSDPVRIKDVLDTVSKAIWIPDARGRSLKVECHHPAIDLALREHVDEANILLEFIWQKIQKKQDLLEALEGLPLRLTSQDIVPEKGEDGTPAYETPHLRFQLANHEIRELLMGEQLYGDPALAIRELYQNALDACRYRSMRISYLKLMKQYDGLKWNGHIIFRQGTVEGRAFIECEDNGIGMGKIELEDAFSRAGRRFVDMPEFIEEQAEWLRCDPTLRLYPNSQFGIGVFSYFMLADELHIETTRLGRDGIPGRTLEVSISGSGSLFRVTTPDKQRSAGSLIRLYLNKDSYKISSGSSKPISCLATLNELLKVAQFKIDVIENGILKGSWEPGVLKSTYNTKPTMCPDIWWFKSYYSNGGQLLADGIDTRSQIKCAIVNLNQAHRPKLTVDRREIVNWDKDFVKCLLRDNIEVLLEDPKWLSYEWLWDLESVDPLVAQRIVEGLLLRNQNETLKLKYASEVEIPLIKLGCFSPDRVLFKMMEDKTIYSNDEIIRHQLDELKNEIKNIEDSSIGSEIDVNEELEEKNKRFNYLESILTEKINSIEHRRRAAQKSIEETYPTYFLKDRLNLLMELGLNLPQWLESMIEDEEEIERMPKVHAGDYLALSSNLDGKSPWIKDKLSAVHVVISALSLDESLSDSLKRFHRLSSIGFSVPVLDLLQLIEIPIDNIDIILLSMNLDGKGPWLSDTVSLIHILRASYVLNKPVGSILRRLNRFKLLGLTIPEANPDQFENINVTEKDLVLLNKDFNIRSNKWIEDNIISEYRVIECAIFLKWSVGDILHRIQHFVPLGLIMPNVDPCEFNDMNVKHLLMAELVARILGEKIHSDKILKIEKTLKLIG